MSERQDIEIDYCPDCRGIWLDRGELDKIIEKSIQHETAAQGSVHSEPRHHQRDYHDDYKYRKRKHWLNELFD